MLEQKKVENNSLRAGVVYLEKLIDQRLALHLSQGEYGEIELPQLPTDGSAFANSIVESKLGELDVIIVLLALLPNLDPSLLSRKLRLHLDGQGDLPIFGGLRGKQHRGILPTGETAQFLIGGESIAARLAVRRLFEQETPLSNSGIVSLGPAPVGEPEMAGQLVVNEEWLQKVFFGKVSLPEFSPTFPAERVNPKLEWEDLVLGERTMNALYPILNYLKFAEKLNDNNNFGRFSRSGYRALFHGPPGTGKTLTAGLLGKASNREVFRVDLSMVVSKYIGETEKNLAGLFEKAEHKNWILFFDEADALFGKRTDVKESKDRYANQEISYLLQRVENYNGLVILATNLKRNMDKAFLRRFEAIVAFPMPTTSERQILWEKMWPTGLELGEDISFEDLAERFELTGAAISNVIRHATIETVAEGETVISKDLIWQSLRREFEKEERVFSAH